jgi:hypothetical protein
MSVFPRLFVFYRISGCFSAMGVQKHYKKVLQTNRVARRKAFTKNSTENPKPIFSRFFFYHVFGRFSVQGELKNTTKNIGK